MKDAPAGKKFYRTIMDDTMPGGAPLSTLHRLTAVTGNGTMRPLGSSLRRSTRRCKFGYERNTSKRFRVFA